MSSDTDAFVPSSEQLIRFIECSGESDNIDAKGPMKWDNAEQSASLSKDIAAFANSTDGGVLVIGKTEIEPGNFDYTGLTEEQAGSFETTKVANWANSRFSPPIRLACHRYEYKDKTFIVITIQEFEDIPTFCTKSYQSQTDARKLILRESTIYVRNQNAESKPVGSVDEWRALIGLATKKRGNELVTIFDAMLKGRPLLEQPSDEDKLQKELQQVWDDLGINPTNTRNNQGAWRLSFHPGSYNPERWNETEALEEVIRNHSIRIYDHFPPYQQGTHPREWGIANDFYGEVWALTKSGIFVFWNEFRENTEICQDPHYRGGEEARKPIPAGEWIDFRWSMRILIEFFIFMSRFVEVYEPGETVSYEISAGPLTNRKLAAAYNPWIVMGFGNPMPCRAKEYRCKASVTVEEMRTNWENHCSTVMKKFFGLFPDHQQISLDTLKQWIEKYKSRDF